MHRTLLSVAGTLTLLLAVGAAFEEGAFATSSDGGGRTISLTERADAVNVLPTPGGGPLGNRFVFSSSLLDGQGSRVGFDGAECTTTNSDGTAICSIAVSLADGQITFQGLANGTDNTFAVTGGTGAYRTARGEARAVDVQPGLAQLTIRLNG